MAHVDFWLDAQNTFHFLHSFVNEIVSIFFPSVFCAFVYFFHFLSPSFSSFSTLALALNFENESHAIVLFLTRWFLVVRFGEQLNVLCVEITKTFFLFLISTLRFWFVQDPLVYRERPNELENYYIETKYIRLDTLFTQSLTMMRWDSWKVIHIYAGPSKIALKWTRLTPHVFSSL